MVTATDGPASLLSVAHVLGASALVVESVTLRSPTLDDVFAELTGSHIDIAGVR